MLVINVHSSLKKTVDLTLANEVAKAFSSRLFKNRNAVVALSLVGTKKMQDLNKQYRSINKPTDVLSFNAPPMPKVSGMPEILGEVIVCHPKVVQQAKRYEHSVQRELGFLIVHGILHLLGHDHHNKQDEQRMTSEAERILAALRLSR